VPCRVVNFEGGSAIVCSRGADRQSRQPSMTGLHQVRSAHVNASSSEKRGDDSPTDLAGVRSAKRGGPTNRAASLTANPTHAACAAAYQAACDENWRRNHPRRR